MALVYCCITHREDIEQTINNINRIDKYVDKIIVIHDESIKLGDSKVFEFRIDKSRAKFTCYPWRDSTSTQRNHYLERLEDGDWVVVSDPDEPFDDLILKDLRKMTSKADETGATRLHLNCHDCWLKDGKIQENTSDYYKPLIFKYKEGVRYKGIIHETLTGDWTDVKLSPKYFYRHIKTHEQVWLRAMRNFYCSGGGDNLIGNKYWLELKSITASLGINEWKPLLAYLEKGKIDNRLKEWMIKHKDLDEEDWHSEIREWFLGYFKVLQPKEMPSDLDKKEELQHWSEGPPIIPKGGLSEFISGLNQIYNASLSRRTSKCEVEYWRGLWESGKIKTHDEIKKILASSKLPAEVIVSNKYQQIFGREVDISGFHTYVTMLKNGSLTERELDKALSSSQEASSEGKAVPLNTDSHIDIDYGTDKSRQTSKVAVVDHMAFISETFRMCSLILEGRIDSFTMTLKQSEEKK